MNKQFKRTKREQKTYENTLKFLDMTEDEFSFYFFELGIKYQKKYSEDSPQILQQTSFWRLLDTFFLKWVSITCKEVIKEGRILYKKKENYTDFEILILDYVYNQINCCFPEKINQNLKLKEEDKKILTENIIVI